MKNNKIIPFIILGIIIRLILSVITYHPDISIFIIAGKTILIDGHLTSFYDTELPKQLVFNYPPLAYFIPSLIYLPFISILENSFDKIINTRPETYIYFPLLIFKLPMILADISIIFLIKKFFNNIDTANKAQLLWIFNPLAIYVSSMMGQVDIIITLLFVLSIISFKSKKYILTSFLIGLSALIKPVGLILIPLIFVYQQLRNHNFLKSAYILFVGFGTFILGIIPFISSPAFRHYALMADQTSKSVYAGITIASGHVIPWFFISFLTIVHFLILKRISLISALSGAILASLVFSHFHPQWFIWATPFILYQLVKTKKIIIWFCAVFAWLIIVFSFDPSLHLNMFLFLTTTFEPAQNLSQYNLILSMARSGLIVLLLSTLTAKTVK